MCGLASSWLCLSGKYVLATAQDVVNGYSIFKELFESTRTGTEQRVLNFYYAFMMEKTQCHVADLTTEYNKSKTGKSISDFTIRYWLERLNEIGYVDKQDDPEDKRKNVYIPLVKQKQELREKALNSENHVDLTTILKNSFETWKTNIAKTTVAYYKNILDNTTTTLKDIEPLILGTDKIISVFDSKLFKYPSELKKELEDQNKLEETLILEIKGNSKILIAKPTKNGQPCQVCGNVASEYELDDKEGKQYVCKTDLLNKIIPDYQNKGYKVTFPMDEEAS